MASPEMSLNTLLFAAEFLDRSDDQDQVRTVTVPLLMTPAEDTTPRLTQQTPVATESANILKKPKKRPGLSPQGQGENENLGNNNGEPLYPLTVHPTTVAQKEKKRPVQCMEESTSPKNGEFRRYDHNDKEKKRRATIRQCFTALKDELMDFIPDSLMAPVRGTDRVSDFAVLQRAQLYIEKLGQEQSFFSKTKSQLLNDRMDILRRLEAISDHLDIPIQCDQYRVIPMASDKIKVEENSQDVVVETHGGKKERKISKVKLDIKLPKFSRPTNPIQFVQPQLTIRTNDLPEEQLQRNLVVLQAAPPQHPVTDIDTVTLPSEFSIDLPSSDPVIPVSDPAEISQMKPFEEELKEVNNVKRSTPSDDQEIDVETVTQDDSQIYINLNDHTDTVQSYVFFPLDQSNVIVEFVDPDSGCIQLPNTESVAEGQSISSSS